MVQAELAQDAITAFKYAADKLRLANSQAEEARESAHHAETKRLEAKDVFLSARSRLMTELGGEGLL